MTTPRPGSRIGSGTKASWADPVERERRLEGIRNARRCDAEPVQRYITEPVRITDIPRDRVEMELFGV